MRYVVYATDDNYAMMAAVSINSLLFNNSSKQEYFLYILSENITEYNKNKLIELCERYSVKIEFIDVVSKLNYLASSFNVPAWNNESYGTYSRLFIGELLPEIIDEVVYFDCDTIVRGDLSEYFNIDFKNEKVLIGAKDIVGNNDMRHKKDIGLEEKTSYINVGVIRINLRNFRKNLCSERLIEHIKNVRSKYQFVDQDILNIVLKDEIQTISPKWNYLSVYYPFDANQLYFMYGVKEKNFYEKDLFESEKDKIAVIHYIGLIFDRPWFSDSNNPLKNEWIKYLQDTPYKDTVLKKTSRTKTFQMMNICFGLLPKPIFAFVYKYMRLIADIKISNAS